jgi:hypothetical protein
MNVRRMASIGWDDDRAAIRRRTGRGERKVIVKRRGGTSRWQEGLLKAGTVEEEEDREGE